MMFVIRNAAQSCVPSHHDERELKEMFQQFRSLPVHSAVKEKCSKDHRVHRKAGMSAWE